MFFKVSIFKILAMAPDAPVIHSGTHIYFSQLTFVYTTRFCFTIVRVCLQSYKRLWAVNTASMNIDNQSINLMVPQLPTCFIPTGKWRLVWRSDPVGEWEAPKRSVCI